MYVCVCVCVCVSLSSHVTCMITCFFFKTDTLTTHRPSIVDFYLAFLSKHTLFYLFSLTDILYSLHLFQVF
jgi:hypothetical protein